LIYQDKSCKKTILIDTNNEVGLERNVSTWSRTWANIQVVAATLFTCVNMVVKSSASHGVCKGASVQRNKTKQMNFACRIVRSHMIQPRCILVFQCEVTFQFRDRNLLRSYRLHVLE
jgi:hypothetical protein